MKILPKRPLLSKVEPVEVVAVGMWATRSLRRVVHISTALEGNECAKLSSSLYDRSTIENEIA